MISAFECWVYNMMITRKNACFTNVLLQRIIYYYSFILIFYNLIIDGVTIILIISRVQLAYANELTTKHTR